MTRRVTAISRAICLYHAQQPIGRPALPRHGHAWLSVPAHASALEVLAANGVHVLIAGGGDECTPMPTISHAILTDNRRSTPCTAGSGITELGELHRLQALEDENWPLKRISEDQVFSIQVLKDAVGNA